MTLLTLYGVLSIAVNAEVMLPTCAQTGEYCDGMEGVGEILFADGIIGSVLVIFLGWEIWRQRLWAWIASIIYFAVALIWTLNVVGRGLDELQFTWVEIPFALNLLILAWLLVPQVLRWCRLRSSSGEGQPKSPSEP